MGRTSNDPGVNLRKLVRNCKKSKVFGKAIVWDAPTWDITNSLKIPGGTGKHSLHFTDNENDTWSRSDVNESFRQPFGDFARVFICCEHKDKKLKNGYKHRLSALRVLERALIESTSEAEVVELDSAIFNRALQIAIAKYKRPIDCQGALQKIASFLNEEHLVASSFSWKGWVKSSHSSTRIDEQEEESRRGKLPSPPALCALGEIFYASKVPADEVITAVFAILMAAPDRAGECSRLTVDSEDEGEVYDESGTVKPTYGLRWRPLKGGKALVKPVLPKWVDITRSAIKKLEKHSAEARKMAAWYHDKDKRGNRSRLYLPEDLELLRGQNLSARNICQLMGWSTQSNFSKFVKDHKLSRIEVHGACKHDKKASVVYPFKEVEKAILSKLPRFFPYISNEKAPGIECSESLMVVPLGLMARTKPGVGMCRCMFEVVSYDQIRQPLAGSIFSRNGKLGPDGKPFKLKTHEPRHMLNTLGFGAGMTDEDVAWWSGRNGITHNADYDHNSKVAKNKIHRDNAAPKNPDRNEVSVNSPISRKEFLRKSAKHVVLSTEYGCCVHSWSVEPCDKLRDCLNCTEHVCFKGDTKKTGRIRQCLVDAENNLDKAEKESAKCHDRERIPGANNANRWINHLRLTIYRLRKLVSYLDDPSVAEGSPIWFNDKGEYSQFRAATEGRSLLGNWEAIALSNYAPTVPASELIGGGK